MILYQRSELIFPHHCIATLGELRTGRWQELVKRIRSLPQDHEDTIAFCFLMVELCGCLSCDLNSYKASLGCQLCAKRAITAFKGSDLTLQRRFEDARAKVRAVMNGEADCLLPVEEEQEEEEED